MLDSGIEELKPSTRKHLRRKLENEFKDTLDMIQIESNKVVVYPDKLTRDELALICSNLKKEVTLLRHCPREVGITEVACMATKVRQSVKNHFSEQQEWPPNVSSLRAGSTLKFLRLLIRSCTITISGSDSLLTDMMKWLKCSVAQDLVFAITRGRFKPAKHILLPSAVKSLTGNVELIQLVNRVFSA